MSKLLIDETSLTSIGDAIRSKTGTSEKLSVPDGMVSAIQGITTSPEEYTITQSASNSTNDNSQTSVIKEQSYGATFTALDGYAVSSIVVTMSGIDISSSVVSILEDGSKGVVTIPSVSGNIVITVTTEIAEIKPIELYTGDVSTYFINKKYSGTSVVDGTGYYLTDIMPVDFKVRPYLNIRGAYNGSEGSTPYIYKIGFYSGETCSKVLYYSNMNGDAGATTWSCDMSASYSDYDGIQILIVPVSSSVTMSESDVLSADEFSVKISTEALY